MANLSVVIVPAKKLSNGRHRIRIAVAYRSIITTECDPTQAPPFKIKTLLPPEVPAPLDECIGISTNDAALWSLDAIYMQEVIPLDE